MPAESRQLANTVVAVTGASSGIGAATARLLLEAGARVTVQARRRERLDAIADKFGGDNLLVVTGDVRDPRSATELVDRAVERFGQLDAEALDGPVDQLSGTPRITNVTGHHEQVVAAELVSNCVEALAPPRLHRDSGPGFQQQPGGGGADSGAGAGHGDDSIG